jgi:hypothetical protein
MRCCWDIYGAGKKEKFKGERFITEGAEGGDTAGAVK